MSMENLVLLQRLSVDGVSAKMQARQPGFCGNKVKQRVFLWQIDPVFLRSSCSKYCDLTAGCNKWRRLPPGTEVDDSMPW